MEPMGTTTGPPGGRPSAGEPVRIWFRVGLLCSLAPNGLVGDGAPRPADERTEDKGFARAGVGPGQTGFPDARPGVLPVRKGFRVLAARGALTSESRLTKEEAEGPRKDSGVRQGRASFPGCRASPSTFRSRASESFMPFCLQLGLASPNGSSSERKMISSVVGKEEGRGAPQGPP